MKKTSDVAITFSLEDYLKGINPKKSITNVRNMLARLSEYKETDKTITIFFDNIDWDDNDKEIASFMDVAKEYDYIFQQICDDDADRHLNVVDPSSELFSLHEEPSVVKKFVI